MQLQPNINFADRYRLLQLIGRGGFSEVWLAEDQYTNLNIAIKVYAPGQGMDSNGLAVFSKEIAGVFNLNHTNLLKPTHVDSWQGMPYLIMQYCSQGSLAGKAGKLTEKQLWHVLHDVAQGLAYLHQNDIVHQDIKPDNILLTDNNNYVITDFGISTKTRATLRKSVIGQQLSAGTLAYMGPERFSNQPAPTKASDIWSLGAMMFELVTEFTPFGDDIGGGMQKAGAEIPLITQNISELLKNTIYQMLAPQTWDRPTAQQLTTIAQQQLNNTNPQHSQPTQPFSKPTQPITQQPTQPITQKPNTDTNNNTGTNGNTHKPNKSIKTILSITISLFIIFIATLISNSISTNRKINKALEVHLTAVNNFNYSISQVNTTKINDNDIYYLRQAASYLQDIYQAEQDQYYKKKKTYVEQNYYNRKTAINDKISAMQKSLQKIKNDAWSSSDSSYKNADKKLKEINKIKNNYAL